MFLPLYGYSSLSLSRVLFMLSEHVCPHNFHGTEPHRTVGAGKLVGAVPPPVVALQRLGTGNPPATVLAASLVAEKIYV